MMKKVLCILGFCLSLCVMCGCQKKDQISLLVPIGSTQLAQLYLQNNPDYSVDTVVGSDPLVAGFSARDYDVIVAPLNLGAKLYQSNQAYRLGAVIVWGNYYLASRDTTLTSWNDLAGQTVVIFGQGQIPDIVLSYLLSELDITIQPLYVDSSATAASMLAVEADKIVMVAEPSVSSLKQQFPNCQLLDIQEKFGEVTDRQAFPQAGVFLRQGFDEEQAAQCLSDLEASINRVNSDPEEAANLAVELGMPFPEDVMSQAIPRSHLLYVSAGDAKSAVEAFLSLVLDFSPGLIGGKLPDAEFYQ